MRARKKIVASVMLLTGCNLLLDNQVGTVGGDDPVAPDGGSWPDASSSGGSSGALNDGGEQDGSDASAPVVVATRDGRSLTVSGGPDRYQLTVPWSPVDNSLIVDVTLPNALSALRYALDGVEVAGGDTGVTIDGAALTPGRAQELTVADRDAAGEPTLVVELTTLVRMQTPHTLPVPRPANQWGVSTPLSLAFAADGARIAVGAPQIVQTTGGVYEFLRTNGSWSLGRELPGVAQVSRSGTTVVYADGKLYVGAPGQKRIVQPDPPAASWSGDTDFGATLAAGRFGVLTINARNVVKLGSAGSTEPAHAGTFEFGAPRLLATAGDLVVAGPVSIDPGTTMLLAFGAGQPNPELVPLEGGERVAAVVMNERFLVVGSPKGQTQAGIQLQIFEREGSSWVSKLRETPRSNSAYFGQSLALCGNLLLVGALQDNFVVSYRLDSATLVDKGTYTLSASGSFFGGVVACAPGKIAIGALDVGATSANFGWIEVYE